MLTAVGPERAAILAAIEAEAAELERYLDTLSEQDLERPSACEGWTNADVVAHLTWASEYFGDLLARALRGDTSPPADLPPPGPARRQRVADRSREYRKTLGGGLRAAFKQANRSLGATFAAVGSDQWELPTAHPSGSIRRLAQSRVLELAVHGWDIRSVLEPVAHLNDASLAVQIDLLGGWYRRLFRPDPGQQRPWRLRFEYPAGDVAPHDLVIGPSEVAFGPASSDLADLLLRCRPEVSLLLALGRIDPTRAAAAYALQVSGRTELLGLLQSRFGAA